MNAMPIKKGLGLMVAWGALAGVTVLLTLLFSILGSLSCAVVAGMILGSTRRWRWDALPVSLVFPAVILALSRCSTFELPATKVYLVAMLTGAAFWMVFGLTLCLRFLERKGGASLSTVPGVTSEAGVATRPDAAATPDRLDLALLRGSWTCEEACPEGLTQNKTLRIEDGKFSLSISKPRRRERVVARGQVRIDETKPGKVEFTNDDPP